MRNLFFSIVAVIALTIATAPHSMASLIYNSIGSTVTQNFDGLGETGATWTDNSTLPGWYSNRVAYLAGTGSSTTGALYSFGVTGVNSITDRALGGVASGGTGTIFWGIALQNQTGALLNSVTITYDGEQWRNGGNETQQSLTFGYVISSTLPSITTGVFTGVAGLNFTGPIATATAGALDGNAAANRVAGISQTLTGLSWTNGSYIMLRWQDLNDVGNDHGLAIDNFSFSAVPEPSAGLLCLMAAAGMIRRRRIG